MRARLELRRHDAQQGGLHRLGRLPRRQARPVGDAKDMGVDRDRRLAEGLVQHDIGGLAPDTREGLQRVSRMGHLAVVPLQQGLAQRQHVLGLVAEQADRLDVLADAILPQGHHGRRRGCRPRTARASPC